jgi:iron uptake system component EfeO
VTGDGEIVTPGTGGDEGAHDREDAGSAGPSRARRALLVALVAVVVVAGGTLAAVELGSGPSAPASVSAPAAAPNLSVTLFSCGPHWTPPPTTGDHQLLISSTSAQGGEVYLESVPQDDIWGETDVFPDQTSTMDVDLAPGHYAFVCAPHEAAASASDVAAVGGPALEGTPYPEPFLVVTTEELAPYVARYATYVAGQLAATRSEVARLAAAEAGGHLAAARADWLVAHMTYHTIGAAYDAFGLFGFEIDGLPDGDASGDGDTTAPTFTGFHKIEQDLWRTDDLAAARVDTGRSPASWVSWPPRSRPPRSAPASSGSARTRSSRTPTGTRSTATTTRGAAPAWRPCTRTPAAISICSGSSSPSSTSARPAWTRRAPASSASCGATSSRHGSTADG